MQNCYRFTAKKLSGFGLAALLVFGLGPAPARALVEANEVRSIIAHIEDTMFPSAAIVDYKLTHLRGNDEVKTFAFEMTMEDDNNLLVMNWPATARHKYLLKAGADLWMYFSDVRRSIRLSARDSFMGTDANNYDLMQLNLLKDYEVVEFSDAELNGEQALKVEFAGKNATEGYAKIVSYISLQEKRLLLNECYSISGHLIKTVRYEQPFDLGRYRIPARVTITSHVNKDRHTVLEISNVRAKGDDEINELIFTLGYLETVP